MTHLSTTVETATLSLAPEDNTRLRVLCGLFNAHLRQIETFFNVNINQRGQQFEVSGAPEQVQRAQTVLKDLYAETAKSPHLSPQNIHLVLRGSQADLQRASHTPPPTTTPEKVNIYIKTKHGIIKPRSQNQARYIECMLTHDINFGIGPAGTGKTYLAVLCAIHALETDQVQRILLVRPAVEAGEKLGFLPGDFIQKIDPYLRPLYDALYEMLGFEKVSKLLERNVIEIAPLAYMRGRTLNDAFIILDESQNTTVQQMKMFLTRVGFGSTVVITGDITQVDLPLKTQSGLRHAMNILDKIKGISMTHFTPEDVVRHPLVQDIIHAYEKDTLRKIETQKAKAKDAKSKQKD